MKLLVNQHEIITHDKLAAVCKSNGAIVCPKVRVKEAVPIDGSGISREHYTFALQSHFDFLVTNDTWNPLFAVEFDGSSHDSPDAERRDAAKNFLCERFELPLLRVNANHLCRRFRQWDLLSYFVEIWFLKRAFDDAQENGVIPWEEGFDAAFVFSNGSGKRWPYWFSLPAENDIRRLKKQGVIAHPSSSYLIGRDDKDNYRCISFLKISDGQWAFVKTGMRSQLFDVCDHEVMWQIATIELHEYLMKVLAGEAGAFSDSEIDEWVRNFDKTYEPCSCGGIVEGPYAAVRGLGSRTD